ncbi:MAG: patatin family protein [Rhodothermaceae bacterium]|nr:patatin family protein [Rhodothermaceae bacterium]
MQVIDHHRTGRVGLALAGGGPEGAIYEIGALRALDDALEGIDFNAVPVTVGVSAGALVGACLANGITTAQLVRSVIHEEPGEQPFRPELFMMPAVGEFVRRGLAVPRHVLEAVMESARRGELGRGLVSRLVGRLGRSLPVGLFDNNALREYLESLFAAEGRTNDFRKLSNQLFLVSADLDAGEPVLFGSERLDHIPIALAVQASTALPGLYPPVEVEGRYYVDGVLLKTLHASVALDNGADLVLCVNPIVPVDTDGAVEQGVMRRGHLLDRGMPTVLSQTFRTLIHSRLDTGLAAYRDRYEGADVVLFEPRRNDYTMFFRNIFSFSARAEVCEHAYRSTLETLATRRDELEPILARHGLRLRDEVLEQPRYDLWASVGMARSANGRRDRKAMLPTTVATRDLRDALDDLDEWLGDA